MFDDNETLYDEVVMMGDQAGIKLEITGGIPTWEAFPSLLHQDILDRIRASIHPLAFGETGCACVHTHDVHIRFSDGSLKRPDISIFCRRPDQTRTAITLLPEAVIEIISEGYAAKDFDIGVPFYLKMGVRDVIVFDPDTNIASHFRPGAAKAEHASPHAFTLACGCAVTV